MKCPKCGLPMKRFIPADGDGGEIRVCVNGLVNPAKPHFSFNLSFFTAAQERSVHNLDRLMRRVQK